MNRTLLSILLLLSGASWPAATAAELPATDPRCELGAAVLKQFLGADRAPVFSRRPIYKLEVQPGSSFGTPVPPAVAKAWNSAPRANLLHDCPTIREQLPGGWRFATDAEEAKTFDGPTIYQIATPVVRGSRGVTQVGARCGGLCGSWHVVLHERRPQGWKVVGQLAMAIS
jgi:hypothetical protein